MTEQPPTPDIEQELKCAFCGRPGGETGPLIAQRRRPDLAICRDCVEWFRDIYHRRDAGETGPIQRPA